MGPLQVWQGVQASKASHGYRPDPPFHVTSLALTQRIWPGRRKVRGWFPDSSRKAGVGDWGKRSLVLRSANCSSFPRAGLSKLDLRVVPTRSVNFLIVPRTFDMITGDTVSTRCGISLEYGLAS